jgi:LPXTG-site transpeptidase (sortase) family protein
MLSDIEASGKKTMRYLDVKAFWRRFSGARDLTVPVLRALQFICFGLGFGLLAFYAAAQTDAAVGRWVAVKQIEGVGEPDQSLWNAKRIKGFQDSLTVEMDDPVGILRIPKISLAVPVFNDSSDLALNRGAGRITGTAPLGAYGNAGISGHRDGFFRGLKDLKVGDRIQVDTQAGSVNYRITDITIVEQNDLQVLDDGYEKTVTLVTCYPFYFVGHAPQRYIVHGVEDNAVPDAWT